MQVPITILIVEDDILIAQDLKEMLEEVGYDDVCRVSNYHQAKEILDTKSIDLVLLDINLGNSLSGVNVAEYINQTNRVPFIYITSYSDVATIAHVKQTRPAGFLLKPYSKNLLLASIEIALFNFSHNTNAADTAIDNAPTENEENDLIINHHLLVNDNYHFTKIPLAEIIWFESDKNYLEVKTQERKYLIRCSLKQLVEHLPDNSFVRCHKQFIINTNYVNGFSSDMVMINGTEIPVSRNMQQQVFAKLKR